MTFRQVREVRVRKRYGGKVLTALVLVTAMVYSGWFFLLRDPQVRTIGADFAFVNGLYQGSKVTILGVPVGRVEELVPRGDHVHVVMSLPKGIDLPADVRAHVLNPSVISDRHLDLAPAYTGGPTLAADSTIPRERTKAPISFDQLIGSLGTLTQILGPSEAPGATDVGTLLNRTAQSWNGRGTKVNQALTELSAASGVFGARADDIGALIASLDQLMATFRAKQVSLDGLVRSMGDLSAQWQAANQDVATPIKNLRVVFDQINGFVVAHGNDVGTVAANLDELGRVVAANRAGFAEFMDLAPLMLQNLSSTIGPDRRGRIRLNVSTTLTQFKTLKPLCDRFPMPICIGAGLTNPIGFPISSSDPLGIVSAITGGQLPPKPGPR
ncbi:Mce family protein [Gordonia araii NBRC 100433]|uniref:Mce family protein n=1 Tax=Gordonia araii NBRC 100433 TaxID=1073574 RepID=G7H5N4_9ACTN|nr:MCE family protein [Gordonia araii]NNG95871.1 MCE family protein [Gordonia araii NBRC 100433]GAB11159.1 Mce family protein [Gordonia araii NBRC 100433]